MRALAMSTIGRRLWALNKHKGVMHSFTESDGRASSVALAAAPLAAADATCDRLLGFDAARRPHLETARESLENLDEHRIQTRGERSAKFATRATGRAQSSGPDQTSCLTGTRQPRLNGLALTLAAGADTPQLFEVKGLTPQPWSRFRGWHNRCYRCSVRSIHKTLAT
jgi:hypothetical protein